MHRLHGQQPRAERVVERFQHSRIEIEVAKIILHRADEPDIVVNFFDADRLAGKNRAEVDLFPTQTDPAHNW